MSIEETCGVGLRCVKCRFGYIPTYTHAYVIETAEQHTRETGHTQFILAVIPRGGK